MSSKHQRRVVVGTCYLACDDNGKAIQFPRTISNYLPIYIYQLELTLTWRCIWTHKGFCCNANYIEKRKKTEQFAAFLGCCDEIIRDKNTRKKNNKKRFATLCPHVPARGRGTSYQINVPANPPPITPKHRGRAQGRKSNKHGCDMTMGLAKCLFLSSYHCCIYFGECTPRHFRHVCVCCC